MEEDEKKVSKIQSQWVLNAGNTFHVLGDRCMRARISLRVLSIVFGFEAHLRIESGNLWSTSGERAMLE